MDMGAFSWWTVNCERDIVQDPFAAHLSVDHLSDDSL
jgi:hypothetical protein